MRTVELMLAGIFIMVLQVDVVRKIYARRQSPFRISEADNELIITKNKGLKHFRFWWVFVLITFYVAYFHYAVSISLHDSAPREPYLISMLLLWCAALFFVGLHYVRFRRNIDITIHRSKQHEVWVNGKHQYIPGCSDGVYVNIRGTLRGLPLYSVTLRTGRDEMLIAEGLSEQEMIELRSKVRSFLVAIPIPTATTVIA